LTNQRGSCYKQRNKQANEKLANLDDKFKDVESVQDGLKKKVKETEMKIETLHNMQTEETTKDHHVQELESALEEALVEREQILGACEKEIEHEKNIAIELEQKMMEDFEWKLREVERGYTTKMKSLEESLESKREIYQQEIFQQQESSAKDLSNWKSFENVLNQKLNEKKQECDDNITYYSQKEAEYDTKVDELMTRLHDLTAAYMKLQSEFDNYEWWDEEEDGEAHGHSYSEDKKRSRESLTNRSRPHTRNCKTNHYKHPRVRRR
jgi:chromosome segregation ATPase